jgi:hypothetical protein
VLRETARPKAETSSELKAKSCAMNVLSDAIEMFKEAETNAMVSQEINFRKAFGNGTNPTQYFLVDVDAMTVGDDEMKRLKTALSSAGSQTSIIIVWSSQSSKSEGELSAKINALSLGEIGASVTQHKVCNNPNGSLAGMAYAAHVAETLGTDINRYLLITSADNFMSTYCWLTVGMRLVNRIFTKGATRIKLSKEEVDALKNVGKLDGKFIEENKDGSMYLIVNPYDTESASKDLAALKGARDKIAKAA